MSKLVTELRGRRCLLFRHRDIWRYEPSSSLFRRIEQAELCQKRVLWGSEPITVEGPYLFVIVGLMMSSSSEQKAEVLVRPFIMDSRKPPFWILTVGGVTRRERRRGEGEGEGGGCAKG
jgi:hypothetical protein